VVCHRRLGFDSVYIHAKFDDSSIANSRYITGGVKIESELFDSDHAPFKGDFICHPYAGI